MSFTARLLSCLLACVAADLAGAASVFAEDIERRIAVRAPRHGVHDPDSARGRTVSIGDHRLSAQPAVEETLADVQYGGAKIRYRGAWLADLLERWRPRPAPGVKRSEDLALLQFSNGMLIPVPLDAAGAPTIRVFVAWQRVVDGRRTRKFPPVERNRSGYSDVRPTRFLGNKVVVSAGDHPFLAPGAKGRFSPWEHADSLVAIELAEADAWYRQFDLAPADDAVGRRGQAVFKSSCQYCHGLRGVGAKFGWDFIRPLAVPEYRPTSKKLLMHVRYRVKDAPAKGLLMPALQWVDERDAMAVLAWLRAAADRPLRPYAPVSARPVGERGAAR